MKNKKLMVLYNIKKHYCQLRYHQKIYKKLMFLIIYDYKIDDYNIKIFNKYFLKNYYYENENILLKMNLILLIIKLKINKIVKYNEKNKF